jgi:hypothetical protein
VAAGTLELRTNLNQFTAAYGASRATGLLIVLIFVVVHWFPPWLDCVACRRNHLPEIQSTIELTV